MNVSYYTLAYVRLISENLRKYLLGHLRAEKATNPLSQPSLG
jgi:hypothetical protein